MRLPKSSAAPAERRVLAAASAHFRHPDFDQSLAYAAAKLSERAIWMCVSGPLGVGKTAFLRALRRLLAGRFTAVHAPFALEGGAELERWLLAQLGRKGSFADEARTLAAQDRPLLVTVDELCAARSDLVSWAERGAAELAMRTVIAWAEPPEAPQPTWLTHCPARVILEPPSLAQVRAYLEAYLAENATEAERAAVRAERLDAIALASAGNLRIVQRHADAELLALRLRKPRAPLTFSQPPRTGLRWWRRGGAWLSRKLAPFAPGRRHRW